MYDFFTNIGHKLAHKIPASKILLKVICKKTEFNMKNEPFTISELKDVFSMKCAGYDDLSFNIIKRCFSVLCKPLKYLFISRKRNPSVV